jgi:hypothetical protein
MERYKSLSEAQNKISPEVAKKELQRINLQLKDMVGDLSDLKKDGYLTRDETVTLQGFVMSLTNILKSKIVCDYSTPTISSKMNSIYHLYSTCRK